MSFVNAGQMRARMSLSLSSSENNISVASEEQLSHVSPSPSSFSIAAGVHVSPSSPPADTSRSNSNAARLVAHMNQSSSLLFDPDEEEDESESWEQEKEEEDEEEEEQAVTATVSRKRPAPTPSTTSPSSPPAAFVCPLTLEVMLDPVLDAQGNTYERQAILTWLDTNRVSPISRQPLHPSMLIPNNSLKGMIHEFMGRQWVEEQRKELQQQQQGLQGSSSQSNSSSSANFCNRSTMNSQSQSTQPSSPFETSEVARSRGKIDAFLAHMSSSSNSGSEGVPSLRLNEQGCAAFRYDSVTVVLDVAGAAGTSMFSLYTRDFLPKQILNYSSPPQASPLFNSQSHAAAAATAASMIKDRVLQLNFLQGETRGGCLSLKQHHIAHASGGAGSRVEEEIIFSYNDRVAELSATDFNNILFNFAESAISLRSQLISLYRATMMRAAAEEEQSLLKMRHQQHQINQQKVQQQQ